MGAVNCATCGVTFTLTDHFERQRRDDHDTFYCPNGHSQFFSDKTENEKLIDQLKRNLDEERQWHTQHFRELIADRDAEYDLARTCPICGERPASRVRIHDNVRARMAEHLRDEHGARQRLRSLPPGESARAS